MIRPTAARTASAGWAGSARSSRFIGWTALAAGVAWVCSAGLAPARAAGEPASTAAPAASAVAAAASASNATAAATTAAAATTSPAWTVVGAQGLVRVVVVPTAAVRDKPAYEHQIRQLCSEPERTCFLNFYGNADGLPVALPLPDAVEQQATAVYRRSAKQGAERFIWSCRLGMPGEACF